jgi:hypothetical protein
MIIPWFGPLPEWISKYRENISKLKSIGYSFMVFTDEKEFRALCKSKVGLNLPETEKFSDKRKPVEFRPLSGIIFEDYLGRFDYWGQTDLDCVYGRLDRFVPDSALAEFDIWSNDIDAICGPFTLYRNCDSVNRSFECGPWKEILESPRLSCFDEKEFSNSVKKSGVKVSYNHFMGADSRDFKNIEFHDDGGLFQHSKEIMMFHFNNCKRWPVQ